MIVEVFDREECNFVFVNTDHITILDPEKARIYFDFGACPDSPDFILSNGFIDTSRDTFNKILEYLQSK